LAQALSTLARILKSGPNVELEQLRFKDLFGGPHSTQELELNLSTLVSLSSVDKSRWIELIHENRFPIEVRARDGSRDVFGKLCSYLDANPQAQEQLKASVSRSSTQTSSPELMRALSTLLKNTPRHDRSADQRDATKHDGANNTKETNNEPPTEGN
jgi:hypothetical protein